MTFVIANPYEGVEAIHYDLSASVSGDDVIAHKSQNHNHTRGGFSDPYEVFDYYAGDGPCPGGHMVAEPYTVFQVNHNGGGGVNYPAEDFGDGGRDPESAGPEGVVFYAGNEELNTEHMLTAFTAVTNNDVGTPDSRYEWINDVIEATNFWQPDADDGGFVMYGHPSSYSTRRAWTRYVEEFADFSEENGLLGMEFGTRRESEIGDNIVIEILLELNHRFMPDRPLYFFNNDDYRSSQTETGEQMDRHFSTVLLTDDEFDPSDQAESQRAAAQALVEGRTFAHRRAEWDADTEDAPAIPKVTHVSVDESEAEITIQADDFDTIEMISKEGINDPAQTETGSPATFQVGFEHIPFVVFRLESNPEAETFTQPFGVATEGDYIGDADIGDATL